MRKAFFLLCVYVVILLIAGCKGDAKTDEFKIEEEKSKITIDSLSSNNDEYTVANAVGVLNPMIFSIDLNEVEVQKISYWIDHYIDGEHVDSFLAMSSEILNEADSIEYQLYFSTTKLESSKERFTVSLRRNKNLSSGSTEYTSLEYDSTITHPINNIVTGLNETTNLGMIVRNKGVEQFGSSDDVDRTISENKEVYVFRCMFN